VRKVIIPVLVLFLIIGAVGLYKQRNTKKSFPNIPNPPNISNTQSGVFDAGGIFTYISELDKSLLGEFIHGAWKIDIDTTLLLDFDVENLNLNLFDSGITRATVRRELDPEDACITLCDWPGFRQCSKKENEECFLPHSITILGSGECSERGECAPAHSITMLVFKNGQIAGSINTSGWIYDISGNESDGFILTKGVQSDLPD